MTGDFHALTSAIDYPMFVVTCADGADGSGGRAGCLVGFATQCSIDPPLYLVCISGTNHTEQIARRATFLAVHLLASNQTHLAQLFGSQTGDEVDKFEQCRWRAGPGGAPLLEECPNRFVGRVVDRRENGDHVAYVLEVVEASADGDSADGGRADGGGADGFEPLTFQQVRELDPGHEA